MSGRWDILEKPGNAADLLFAEITTDRLVLRWPEWRDVDAIERGMRDERVAEMIGGPPWPYPDGAAEEWVAGARSARRGGEMFYCAVGLRCDGGRFVGACSIRLSWRHGRGTLGYWLVPEEWGKGFASEFAAALVECGFGEFGLNKLEASAYADNPASGRVLEKCGFEREGLRRQQIHRAGRFRDELLYGVLRGQWMARKES